MLDRLRAHRRMDDERGAILVLMVMTMVVLLGFSALVVDLGNSRQTRRQAQNSSDAAALAGAYTLQSGGTAAQARTAAESYAANNGFGAGLGVAYSPPVSGPRTGNANCVEVVSRKTMPGTFSKAIGQNTIGASGRAVACRTTNTIGDFALITLGRHACPALEVIGSLNITLTHGGIYNNGDCDDALTSIGSGNITAAVIDIVGNFTKIGSGNISPDPTVGAAPITDPYASLPAPTPPTSPVRTCPTMTGSTDHTLQPGYYNCTLSSAGSGDITFAPGDYHITGGVIFSGSGSITFGAGIYTVAGLSANGSGPITANNVMFYVPSGSFRLAGSGGMSVSPTTTAPWAGISVFQARGNTNEMNVSGSGGTVSGTLYAPDAHLRWNGSGGAATRYSVVADSFSMIGSGGFSSTATGATLTSTNGVALFE